MHVVTGTQRRENGSHTSVPRQSVSRAQLVGTQRPASQRVPAAHASSVVHVQSAPLHGLAHAPPRQTSGLMQSASETHAVTAVHVPARQRSPVAQSRSEPQPITTRQPPSMQTAPTGQSRESTHSVVQLPATQTSGVGQSLVRVHDVLAASPVVPASSVGVCV